MPGAVGVNWMAVPVPKASGGTGPVPSGSTDQLTLTWSLWVGLVPGSLGVAVRLISRPTLGAPPPATVSPTASDGATLPTATAGPTATALRPGLRVADGEGDDVGARCRPG